VLQTRSSILLVAQTNTDAGGGSSVIIVNSQNLGVNVQNSAGWTVNVANTSPLVSIQNSAGWIVYVANTVAGGSAVSITNSGGLYAMQSGTWNVNVSNTGGSVVVSNTQTAINIINSAGWIMAQSNTSPLVQVQNSAGWVVNVANTANRTVIVNNSGGLFAQQSGAWTVTINNTGGTTLSQTIANTAGWIISQANTAGMTVNVINSGNWVIAQSNTNGLVTTYDTNKVFDGTTSTVMKYRNIVVGGSGNTMLVNAVSGKRIRVVSMALIANGTGTVFIQNDSTSATNLLGPMFLAANVGFVLPFHQNGWFQTGTSLLLNLSSSTINSMGGCLTYLETS